MSAEKAILFLEVFKMPSFWMDKMAIDYAISAIRKLERAEAAMRSAQEQGTLTDAWDKLETYFETEGE